MFTNCCYNRCKKYVAIFLISRYVHFIFSYFILVYSCAQKFKLTKLMYLYPIQYVKLK